MLAAIETTVPWAPVVLAILIGLVLAGVARVERRLNRPRTSHYRAPGS